MFLAARWRSEKNKIKNKDKAFFRFEFHATQMTKLGWEVATVSVVPIEVGKPTATSEKVVVLDGNCTWKKPIYETVRFIDEKEKENLRREVFRLRDELCKKRDRIAAAERKLKDGNSRRMSSSSSSSNGAMKTSPRSKNNINGPAPHGSKEVSALQEKIKLVEGKMKMKDVTLEDVTNSFRTKEKELRDRIEELEKSVRQYRDIHQGKIHKEPMTVDKRSDLANADKPTVGGEEAIYDQNGTSREVILSTVENEKGGIVPNSQTQSSCEVSVLKENNIAMEAELKEIKERYSEISLKFAEVEGERQQLVMTVRSLKNS